MIYNRYIPETDGTYRKQLISTEAPLRKEQITSCSFDSQHELKQIKRDSKSLPFGFDLGDLLLLCIVILLLLESEEDDMMSILVAAAAFILLQ